MKLLGYLTAFFFFIQYPIQANAAEPVFTMTYLKEAFTRFLDARDLDISYIGFVLGATLCGLGFISIFLRRKRFARSKAARAVRELALMEERLNETEALLLAEPQLLYVWEGDAEMPIRVSGELHNVKGIPYKENDRLNFSSWIDSQSSIEIDSELKKLRKTGEAFNAVVSMKNGTFLEADGRAAGRFTTLRLREIAGQKVDMSKLTQDYQRLKQQTEAIRAVMNEAPMPIWVRDVSGRINWANSAYVSAVDSLDVKSVIEQQIELLPKNTDEDGDQTKSETGEMSGGEPGKFERVHTVVAGSRRAMDIVSIDLKNGSANLAIDVNALEEAQDELKLHMSAHASTLDKLLTAVAVFGPDQSLKFFNPAFVSLWGLDPEWLKTGPKDGEILDKLRDERNLPEQANYRTWKAEYLETYTNLEPMQDEWHLPDGRAISIVAEQHPFGGVTYLYENLTDRFKLESNYNELISVQRETLNHSQEGVAFFGSGGRLELFNSAFAKLWKLDETLLNSSPHIDEVIKECRKLFDYENAWNDLKAVVTSIVGEREVKRARITRPDGVVLDLSLVPLPDGATLLTYVDVSDSWRTEKALNEKNEALKTADHLKTQFLNHMSYQLRTPLTNIIGFAETMDMGIAGEMNAKQQDYVKDILGSSKSLLGIINNILDMASIDSGNIEIELQDVDIKAMVSQSLDLVKGELDNRKINLVTHFDEDLNIIKADPERLEQVIYNIVTNAVGFSDIGETVEISATREGEEMVLTVSDNGPGMEPGEIDKIFGRFVSSSEGSNHRGTGLGLSLVKSFVELHGGRVEVSSEKGKGMEVCCRLPINGHAQITGSTQSPDHVQDAAITA